MFALVPWFLSMEEVPEFRLAHLFTDHVVLQRETNAPVWGWAPPGSKVTVKASWMKTAIEATAGQDGKWMAKVRTGAAGTGHQLTASHQGKTLTVQDVAIGEVWLMGGQSNMEWMIDWCAGGHPTLSANEVKQDANRPGIRYFFVQKNMSPTSLPDLEASWQTVNSETVGGCSAVAYWFARKLQEHLDVPVGLLNCAYGGSEIEQWISDPVMRKIGPFKERIDEQEAAIRALPPLKWAPSIADAPSDKWTQMHGVLNARHWGGWEFKGVIWHRASFDADFEGEATLQLGPLDFADVAWVNGEKVGSAQGDSVLRSYPIKVKKGKNDVMVAVLSFTSAGGFSDSAKPKIIRNGKGQSIQGWEVAFGKPLDEVAPPARRWSRMKQAMLDPLAPFAIRGMAWYQGESNVGRAAEYETALKAMIADWRKSFGRGKPFGVIQIAPWNGYGEGTAAADLREAEARVAKDSGVGLIVTTDLVSDLNDIHPRDKFTVGWRLGTWALREAYGLKGFAATSPQWTRSSSEGNKMKVEFDQPLRTRDRKAATHVVIAGPDKVFHPADVRLDGSILYATSPQVPKPVAVRFAWSSAPTPNLVGESGWPVVPFRTDRWPTASGRW